MKRPYRGRSLPHSYYKYSSYLLSDITHGPTVFY